MSYPIAMVVVGIVVVIFGSVLVEFDDDDVNCTITSSYVTIVPAT